MSQLVVDMMNSMNVIFKHAIDRLDDRNATLKEKPMLLVGFSKGSVWLLGMISLLVKVEARKNLLIVMVKFMVAPTTQYWVVL